MHLYMLIAVLVVCILAVSVLSKRPNNVGRAVPGPRRLPLIGNLLDLPATFQYVTLKDWAKIYGPLMKISVLGKDMYIISSEKIANDLCRMKGAIYSSRPTFPAAGVLLGNNNFPVLLPYDPLRKPERSDVWNKGRKFEHRILGPSAVLQYSKTHELESCKMVRNIIKDPADYDAILHRYAGAIVFRLTYGKTLETGHEYHVRKALDLLHVFEDAVMPGRYLVDLFPFLMYLPKAIAPFKKYLLTQREEHDKYFLELQDNVRQEMKENKAPPSFQKTLLENKESVGLSTMDSAHLLGTIFGAGSGSSAAILIITILKMIHHPEWQKALHDEVDQQIGAHRVPNFDDLPRLPTVRAVVKEVIRLSVPGMPREVIKDDWYGDYFIPAGSFIMPNGWAIGRDPDLYPDPEAFNPGRWLSPKFPTTYREPLTKYPNLQQFSIFGYGRRICPGLSLAERTLNIAVARLMWACNISHKIGPDGKEIEVPEFDYTTDLISRPKPFQFDLKARSEKHLEALNEEIAQAMDADPLKGTSSYELSNEELME